nr:thermonuclease family protein [candidate division Zixibacteria bacterium]
MKKTTRIILVLIFILFLILIRFVVEIGQDKAPDNRFRVTGIIDGDTVELPGGDRLRLIGIDCPERGDPFYDSASAFMSGLLLDQIPEVVYSSRRRDGYGRQLGYLYLDTLFVNAAVLRQGLACVYLFDDNLADRGRIGELLAAQNVAIDQRRGIWSLPHHEEPYYVAKKGSLRFHRPTCRSVRDLDPGQQLRFETRLEALRQGYSPCRNCRP